MIVVYTVSGQSVCYLLVDDMAARRIEGPPWAAEQALLLRYSNARYLDPKMFEDVIFTRQIHENARLTTLRRLQKKEQAS
jgi:hypothetical protein